MKRIAGILAAALLVCLFAVGCAGESGSADNAITVSATAAAEVEPDTASIAFTVGAFADTEEAARVAGEQAASSVEARLSTLGIAEGDVKVGALEVSERYGEETIEYVPSGYFDFDGNWVETVDEVYYDGRGDLVGYDVKASVQVEGIPADRLGQVLRESVDAGASDFNGLEFAVADREAAYQEALAQAVDAAHEKAESLAQASGVYVGRVVNVVENSSVPEEVTMQADSSIIDPSNPATFELVLDKAPVEASVTVSYAIS